jgi:steroid delta-isomerase-like uncharacterized protein
MNPLTEQEARQMIAVVNTRNVDKVIEQYADDATFQVPSLSAPLKGKPAIRSFLTESFVAFPDWTLDVSKVIISGDNVVTVGSVSGTHNGPLTGADGKAIAPTHKKFVQEQLTRLVFNQHGKVESFRAYGNASDLYHQLGLGK